CAEQVLVPDFSRQALMDLRGKLIDLAAAGFYIGNFFALVVLARQLVAPRHLQDDFVVPGLLGFLGAVDAAGRQDDLDAAFAARGPDDDVVEVIGVDAAFERFGQEAGAVLAALAGLAALDLLARIDFVD